MTIEKVKNELKSCANPEKIKIYKNFHKTSSGNYASGEEFLGVTVPDIRKIAMNNLDLSNRDILKLLESNIHEEKYVAAEIIAGKYKTSLNKKGVFDFYIKNASKLSGWDLVDTTASQVVGHFLFHFGKEYPAYKIILANLAKSSNIWQKRIAIISTYYFIKNNKFDETLRISQILINDEHDLIHKAVGWMLREVGKRDLKILEDFLKKYHKSMPRTMLRYAIEKFSDKKRKEYLTANKKL